jgi:REP element-mobilizing transposase RayT
MSRGNGKMRIFLDDADFRQFVYLLGQVVEEFAIDCWNYCLMPNHYHVTLQPTQPNLSQAIRRLNGVYGHWWNRRHQRVGHVFQGRFKAQIVDRDGYLLALSRYVVMNPVRAGLVDAPEEWIWSSYRATAGLDPAPAFLATDSTLRLFGDGPEASLQTWFANAMTTSDEGSVLVDRIRSNERVLGGREFKGRVELSGSQGV